jgi:hypothetical protein
VYEARRQELLDNPRPRRPARTWSLEEDALVVEAALRKEGGNGGSANHYFAPRCK